MKEIIAQTAGRLVEEIFKTIEKVGMSNVGKTAEELFAVLKNGTLEVLAAAIGEMDAAVLSAKKERKLDGLTVKERNVPRTFTTSLGELHYGRKQRVLLCAGYQRFSARAGEDKPKQQHGCQLYCGCAGFCHVHRRRRFGWIPDDSKP